MPRALKSAKEDDTAQEKLRPHSLSFTFSAKQSTEQELQVEKWYFVAYILMAFVPLSKARSTALLHSLHQLMN